MAEESDKVETEPVKEADPEPVKEADPEPVKEAEPITSEPLKETRKKTSKTPKSKNIKVIPVASDLDVGIPHEKDSKKQEASPVETPPEPEEPKKDKKEVKVLELVKCNGCNRRMTEKTLKYSHEDKCPAKQPKPTTPVVMKTRSKKNTAIEEEVKQAPEPARKSAIELRHERIHNKQEAYKQLFKNAF
jgi:hypothetical protein